MMRKLFAGLALLCVSAAPTDYPGGKRVVEYPLVHQVMCEGGTLRGTAFRTGETTFVTAAHVAANYDCKIDGAPVKIDSIKGSLDIATIEAGKRKLGAFAVNCDGFKVGHWYLAVGYAHGGPAQVMVPIYAVALRHRSGMQLFSGPELVIPGMSGGPVMDSDGRVVGIVNARNDDYHLSFSRALKDTAVCH